jgi:hypothetical protein
MVRFADGGKGAESSAPYEPSAAHAVDLSSLRRTPLWNVVVNSITYMCSACLSAHRTIESRP